MSDMPKAYDFSSNRRAYLPVVGRERLVQAGNPTCRCQALRHFHPAAQRDRRAAHGPRHVCGAGRPDDSPRADAGPGCAVGARHRPCGHRHPTAGGKNAAARRHFSRGSGPRRIFATAPGNGKRSMAATSPSSCATWARHAIGIASASRWMTGCPAPCVRRLCACIAWV